MANNTVMNVLFNDAIWVIKKSSDRENVFMYTQTPEGYISYLQYIPGSRGRVSWWPDLNTLLKSLAAGGTGEFVRYQWPSGAKWEF